MKREALARAAAEIVMSYVSNRKVPVSDMRILIVGVCGALSSLRPPIAAAIAPRRKRREGR
jgi:predicted transcriptional regulator